MRTIQYISLLLLLSSTGVFAQPLDHDHETLASFDPAPAQYAIQARIDDSRSRVVAWMDVACANHSDTTVRHLLFEIPGHDRFHLDSILLFGAPLETDRIKILGEWLELQLPVRPGEQVPLQFSFSTHVSGLSKLRDSRGSVLIDAWYPRLIAYKSDFQSIPELADFRVEIVTDSALSIAAPGTWINEIEHVGSIPERADTTFTDLLSRLEPNAQRRIFAYRLTGAEQFSFAVLHHCSLTRIQFNQQRIDLFGAVDFSEGDRSKFANAVAKVSRAVVERLGALPDGRFCAFFGEVDPLSLHADRLARVFVGSRNPDLMLVDLTSQLAAQYFNRTCVPANALPWSEGASVFAAIDVLHQLYPDRGYPMVEKWLDYQLPPREIRTPLSSRPFAWMDNLRRANRPLSQADSLRFLQLFQAPSVLQIIAAGTSTEALLSLLHRYSLDVRHRHAYPDELPHLVSKELGVQWETWLQECTADRESFDWSIGSVAIEPSGDAFITQIETVARRLADLPLDIALTNGHDSLTAKYLPIGPDGKRAPFLVQTAFHPTAILLDPYHRLPDHNRQNNVWISGRTGMRYNKDRREYPTYRRMTLGD